MTFFLIWLAGMPVFVLFCSFSYHKGWTWATENKDMVMTPLGILTVTFWPIIVFAMLVAGGLWCCGPGMWKLGLKIARKLQ